MTLSPRQESAISHYLTHNPGVRLSIQGLPGVVYFADKASGKQSTMAMSELLEQYDADRRASSKVRSRERRQATKQATMGGPRYSRRSA